MKILVAGSEGGLMQAVIPHLLTQGHGVRGVDMVPKKNQLPYEFLEGDLSSDGNVAMQATVDIDVLIHAAATVYGVAGISSFTEQEEQIMMDPSLEYDRKLLTPAAKMGLYLREAVRKCKIKKTCYISSSCVYDLNNTFSRKYLRWWGVPEQEEEINYDFEAYKWNEKLHGPPRDPWKIKMYYALNKLIQERLWSNDLPFHEESTGAPCIIWRPFNIIGPEKAKGQEQGKSHVFVDFVRNIVLKKLNPLPILGDGYQVRCFSWVDDVADAIARFTFQEFQRTSSTIDKEFGISLKNEIFNVGTPQPVAMRQLAEMIYQTAQKLDLLPKTSEPLAFIPHGASYVADIRYRVTSVWKIYRRGWEPQVQIEEAIERLLGNTAWLESLRN